MAGWRKVREHVWPDEHGNPVLKHTKMDKGGGVFAFPWEHWIFWPETGKGRWFDGIGADDGIVHPLLYRRDVLARANRSADILVVEGEADADAALAAGLLAVTAGHAGAFGREHAALFKGWRGRITVVRDNDLPGAYGAAKAYGALRAVGIPASALRVARGRCKGVGTDLRDHLRRHTVEELKSEPIAHVRRLAERATPESFARAGYGSGVNPETGFVWVGADESAQLRGWKPVAS